ncbi:MurR/RpiR family transcriptional regulator [Geochorda subterranea]|uniref:MurR/RpiR family transcriptional regulator n=1 Tax=Geochorda subterranea TaxID=3109564 RepID=A0ABZ1BP68_9FIRM|nr:MurR/RpiR family transcriptional regulator [Limnochorda sp. LNt]WRP14285.1 MurR/RpiR family transcriptional regulator [Limnochorda sp. LNt]
MRRQPTAPADQLPEACLARMRGLYARLRPSERRVADYILSRPAEAVHLSITALAEQTRTSESTVVKFAQRLGYEGYQQMRIALAVESGAREPATSLPVYGEIEAGDDLPTIRQKLLAHYQQALQETLALFDERVWARAVDVIVQARRLHFYGVGASGFVALDAQHKFARIGLDAWAYLDPHLQSTFAALLGPRDVAVAISHSGGTIDTLHAMQTAARAGATTIAVTHQMESPIAQRADIVFFTGGQEGLFRSGAIVSRMAQLAVVDALFIAVTIRMGAGAMERLMRSRQAVADKHLRPGARGGGGARGSPRRGRSVETTHDDEEVLR